MYEDLMVVVYVEKVEELIENDYRLWKFNYDNVFYLYYCV